MNGFFLRHTFKATLFLLLLSGCVLSEEKRTQKEIIAILQDALRNENYFVRSAAVKAIVAQALATSTVMVCAPMLTVSPAIG